jgi:actin-related protein
VPDVPIEETPVPDVPIEETPVPDVPIEETPVPEVPIEETQDCSYQEDTSNNTSSEALIESDVLIEDLERSPPQISKRIESSPPVTSTTTTTTINTAVIKAMDPINSSATKTSSESDEMSSGGTERKPLAIRSNSVFYDDKTSPLLIEAAKPGKVKQSKTFRKSKKKDLENALSASPDVSLLAPVQTMHWDPTCLLEELYNDCRPGTAHPSGAETCRYSGYLDKLPVNQRKPSVIKGWKHRFFKLTRGSLFYFDDANASKATSFIRLSDSRIVLHSDSLKLEIVEKGGNFILLRVDNRTDFNTWHRHLQLEAVHPTMTHRVNISPTPLSPVIIVDLGSSSVRAGLLSDDTSYPQLFFPNVCAANGDTIIACGNGALLPETRKDTKSIHPCRHRMRYDSTLPIRNCYQYIFETICKLLHVEPHKMSVLVSISPAMSTNEQTELAEVLLEVLGFKSILFQEQTTLALYSYNNTSGIVVNVGDSTHVTPIIDGFKIDSGSSYSPFGGHNITENLSKLATAKDIRYFSESEMYIVRYIKENICFISQNFAEDTMKCEESSVEYVRAIDVDRFQLPDHRKVIHLDSASFKAPEGLFTPGLWGKDTIGLHEMVHKAIDHCPMDMRRLMCKHIYLGGGTTLLDGFQERLEKELKSLYPRMDVQVHADDNRHHAAFLGGAILASLNSFSKSLVDLDNWTANGLEAMRQTADT